MPALIDVGLIVHQIALYQQSYLG
uniref:Uncharacterized protein n=1 Tax=Physcomitrium patens TaxID=3218 RepID=A0A2K1JJ20_PHYPA|nr:hypothetical protein PHYPA_018729 [Physcomitrium patens]